MSDQPIIMNKLTHPESPSVARPPSVGVGYAATALIALAVSATLIVAYDYKVRSRVARFATVDIGEIYSANQNAAFKRVLAARQVSSSQEPVDAGKLGQEAALAMANQLKEFSTQCECLLIAAPAVYGRIESVPDYTEEIKHKFSLTTSVNELQQMIQSDQKYRPQGTQVLPQGGVGGLVK